jgi:alkylated DNA repair protein (DNA oxidative demethylase)
MTLHLFGQAKQGQTWREDLCLGAVVLRGFAVPDATAIFTALHGITTHAPFRHMLTPGGFRMSVAMTNCGAYGWVTGRCLKGVDVLSSVSVSEQQPPYDCVAS